MARIAIAAFDDDSRQLAEKGGSLLAQISNAFVTMQKDYWGIGPLEAKSYMMDDLLLENEMTQKDLVTVVLQDTLTKAERTLLAHDRSELVLTTRRAFQDAMQADFVAGLHEILGREVVAFLSANHADPDYAVETFILAPEAELVPSAPDG